MSTYPAFVRRVFWMAMVLALTVPCGPVFAQSSDLEGTQGHGPPAGASALEGTQGPTPANDLSALEGTTGHPAGKPTDDGIVCPPGSPCLEAATQLPLRVLPRPFSAIHREALADPANVVQANVPAFKPLYVFNRREIDLSRPDDPKGWYQVGRTRTAPEGWMQAKDVLEWRQALLVSYTHPGNELEGRSPVLMFRHRADLESIVDDMDMAGRAKALYEAIASGKIPDQVVSMEPKRFVDITKRFYVLPILQWSQTQINGDDVRLLQVAAAVPGARGADTVRNPDYLEQAQVGRGQGGAVLQDVKADIVFVIDTSRSMQPFIDMTRDAVAQMSRQFSAETADRFRFGLVVFRDSLEVAPQLEYVARSLTPELVSAQDLVGLLEREAGATAVGSVDYAEEVFAGVDLALHSKWRQGALRFVILIGDASSHPKGHPQNTTGKDETDLRREYDDAQVHLFAIHLQDPRAKEDHPLAQAQFGHLARVRGSESSSAIKEVNAFEEGEYRALVEHLTGRITALLNQTMGNGTAAQAAPLAEFDKLWEAALIEYVGKEAAPPKDIVAWTLDRDLVNPANKALEVRVLVTREQLSTLAQTLDQVVQALMRAEVTQGQFFDALQSVAGQAMKRPEDLGGAVRLADTGLLPAFIQSLPYKSDILALTEDMFASMTAEQRSQLEWSILAKLDQYRTINEQVDAWFRLNDTDPDQDMVYPLHLDYLP
ncbi:von Willebrand factor type A domain-containing protein [Desulfacinum infernum DSM 9756]|uniref:von Willebrand factor type A domain-containing protein n=1 Tax=Desulfacinum infernum DSM 9756 TaxID=1121391 RepID=A0A1M5ABR0_9BACT|nr:vWA domain-containing protein [Desulfacinum infernum]SHF27761.1 von Willebrand factor type A domain-containing protein [Desulfacinum infernum DSM 9756]